MFGEQRGVRRAHSPDEFENNNFQRGGQPPPYARGPGNYHHQPFHKRHRGDNYHQGSLSIEERIARLGETGSRNADIGALAKDIDIDLGNKSQDEERIKALSAKICQCVVSFPTRVGAYACLIGLISVKHYNVACQIINCLHTSYPLYLDAEKWQEAITIVHLLASLVNCNVIRASALLTQFQLLLEASIGENDPQARSDYFAYTVLSSMPYVALELSSQPEVEEQLEQVFKTIESYLIRRSKRHLNNIRVWISSDSTIQMDYLDSLWVQMKNFKANGWSEGFLHRPYNDKDYKDVMAASLIPTDSPTFQITPHDSSISYPAPRITFRLFEDDVVEGNKAIPGSDKIERFCVENHVRNIIDELYDDPRSCARHLGNMYRSDQLPMKHILVETLLGELFTLPKPKHPEILYHSLLYEFTKIFYPPSANAVDLKDNYDVIVNQAVKILYDNLESMNVTCHTRFTQWFSFHLNNIEFVFPWQTFENATIADATSFRSCFVKDILDRCVRLKYHETIEKLIKENNLTSLMPPKVAVEFKPVFADHKDAEELAASIKKLIIHKADGKTICESLNIIVEGVDLPEDFVVKEEKLSDQLLKVDIFTSVLLFIASKSLTHVSSALGKFKNVLKALAKGSQGQTQILRTVQSCLEQHPQLLVILVDKLLKAGLINPGEICNWIFSDSMKPNLLKSYVWELLNNTLRKSSQLADQMVADKGKLKEKIQAKADEPKEVVTTEGEDVEMTDQKEDVQKEIMQRQLVEYDGKIEAARSGHTQLTLEVFKMFASLLDEHIKKCAASNTSFLDDFHRWTVGRMQEVYYMHFDLTNRLCDRIKTIIENVPSIESSIINLNQ